MHGFLARYIFRYRLSTVRQNLEIAFPDASAEQRQEIERGFYAHFADILSESLTMMFCSRKRMREILRFENVELGEQISREQGDMVAVFGHQCNWDLVASIPLWTKEFDSYALYKQLHSRLFDHLFRSIRERFGLKSIEHKGAARRIMYIRRDSKRPSLFAFNTDQSPHSTWQVEWITFFGRETAAVPGWAEIAMRMHMPVIYLHLTHHGHKSYSVLAELIWDGKSPITQHDLVQHYYTLLEADIRRQPDQYLWSHRRWKFNKNENE